MKAPLPSASLIVDLRIDEVMGQLASTRAKVVSITAKQHGLEDAHNNAKPKAEILVRNTETETKTSENSTMAKRDGASSCFHGVMRSVRGIAEVANERNAGHSDALSQFWPLF